MENTPPEYRMWFRISLRTGSQRGRKKKLASEASGSRSVNLRAKRMGRGGACRHCF